MKSQNHKVWIGNGFYGTLKMPVICLMALLTKHIMTILKMLYIILTLHMHNNA